jgi:hypothetical protein
MPMLFCEISFEIHEFVFMKNNTADILPDFNQHSPWPIIFMAASNFVTIHEMGLLSRRDESVKLVGFSHEARTILKVEIVTMPVMHDSSDSKLTFVFVHIF